MGGSGVIASITTVADVKGCGVVLAFGPHAANAIIAANATLLMSIMRSRWASNPHGLHGPYTLSKHAALPTTRQLHVHAMGD